MGELLAEYDVLGAFWMTIKLTVLSALGALVLGTVIAVMRVSPVRVLRAAGTAYVTLVRNTPLTLIVFFCAFGFYITLQYRIGPARHDQYGNFWRGCAGAQCQLQSVVCSEPDFRHQDERAAPDQQRSLIVIVIRRPDAESCGTECGRHEQSIGRVRVYDQNRKIR